MKIPSPLSILFVSALLATGGSLSACSLFSKDRNVEVDVNSRTAEELYQDAQQEMQAGNYRLAIPLFDKVEQEYPYSTYATEAQLMAARAAYEDDQYEDAIVALNRFIDLHPGNKNIDYAYYLKSLAYYEQISDVSRDQQVTSQALQAFDALLQRYPDSEYARDARLKRDLTLDHLAGKEMQIGRYYQRKNQINAAIIRFQNVVRDYQTTSHTPEALHRLVESYLNLGLREEAVQIASVLGHNYPGSEWYEDTYDILDDASRARLLEERSLLDRTVDSIFLPE